MTAATAWRPGSCPHRIYLVMFEGGALGPLGVEGEARPSRRLPAVAAPNRILPIGWLPNPGDPVHDSKGETL